MAALPETSPHTHERPEFDRAIIIYNPTCSDAHLERRAMAWLHEQALFKKAPELAMRASDSDGGNTANIELVRRAVGNDRVLVAVLSGDGGFRRTAEGVADTESTIVGIGLGNGNILHAILNGKRGIKRPPQLYDTSRATTAHLPFLRVEANGLSHLALLGAGFGLTGTFIHARDLHREEASHNRSIARTWREFDIALRMMQETGAGQHGVDVNDRKLLSYDIINGPLLAKYARFPRLEIAASEALEIVLAQQKDVPRWVRQTQNGAWPTTRMHTATPQDRSRTVRIGTSGAEAYIDGDALTLNPHSDFSVSISDTSVRALVNKEARITIPRVPILAYVSAAACSILMRKGQHRQM